MLRAQIEQRFVLIVSDTGIPQTEQLWLGGMFIRAPIVPHTYRSASSRTLEPQRLRCGVDGLLTMICSAGIAPAQP